MAGAAGGATSRIGGGPSTVRQILEADLIDFMHLVIVPVELGHGTRPWGDLTEIEQRFDVETISSSSGSSHQLWNRKARG